MNADDFTRRREFDDEDTVIVCSPADVDHDIPGGVMVNCVECDMPAYVSPSSFDVLAEGAHVLCYRCFKRRVDDDPETMLSNIQPHPNHKAQSAEMLEWLRRRQEK